MLLEGKGIKYGVADDTSIVKYLAHISTQKKLWKIASGQAPGSGQDWKIEYHFDMDPLKGGTLKEFGLFEYTDRIKNLQVRKGDLIAEKVPGTEGTTGKDVFGQPILPPKPKDVELRRGNGAELSGDGLKIFAQKDGRPEISKNGEICVFPCLHIPGDAEKENGNVEFDGHIEIQGTIQNGIRICGKSLLSNEILKADVEIFGDIVVQRGISEASIKTWGNLMAKHIQKTNIEALGDIAVENEIIDSNIETNGKCAIEKGKIRSSTIAAKKGIRALEIGSDASSSCTLDVGFDYWTQREVADIKDQIAGKEKEEEKLESGLGELQEEIDKLDEKIEEIAQEEGPIRIQQVAMQKEMDECKKLNKKEQMAEIDETVKQLILKIDQINETVGRLFNEQEQIADKISIHQNEIKNSQKEVEELRNEIRRKTELSKIDTGMPVVNILGTIFAKSEIKSPHSMITLEDNYQNVSIMELEKTSSGSSDSSGKYHMSISKIK